MDCEDSVDCTGVQGKQGRRYMIRYKSTEVIRRMVDGQWSIGQVCLLNVDQSISII